ncbi:MAG: alpha/beta fold hydrolase [Burkholderiales bacterium]|nr:alpha/beta fold hydrolase [Burkholderiales bacterium]
MHPRAIREQGYVTLNGIPQWLTITGQDCRNPVLLFLHGGPGNPLSPYADAVYGAWAKDFTLVQWDQRGAGRTYGRNLPVRELEADEFERTPLNLALMAADGIAAVEYLQQRLGQRQVILTGSSWGSALGVEMVSLRPGLFHAYVGLSQMVGHRSLDASYAAMLQRAQDLGDQPSLAVLKTIGPPPWQNPRHFGQMRRILRGYEAQRSEPAPAWRPAAEYAGAPDRAADEAGEDFSFLKFVGLNGDGMLWQLKLDEQRTRLAVPIFLLQGAEDLLTPPAATQAYFDRLEAPRKQLVMVPKAGHDPNGPMLAAQQRLLLNDVLPLTRKRAAP